MGSMRDVCRAAGTLVRNAVRSHLEALKELAAFPPTAVLVGSLMVIDVLLLDSASLVGGVSCGLFRTGRTGCHFRRQEIVQVNQRSDGTLVVHDMSGAWSSPSDETELGRFAPISQYSASGFWALTSTTRHYSLAQIDGAPVLGTPLEADVRRALCEARGRFIDQRAAEAAEMIVDGDKTVRVVLPGGYVHNCLSASGGALFGYSIAVHAAEWLRMRTRRRRVEAGVCPNCVYDRSGNHTTTCPECGVDTRIWV